MLYQRPVPESEVREAELHELPTYHRRWCSYSYGWCNCKVAADPV